MKASVTLDGKSVRIELTRAAAHALAERATPLLAEMELYFSCLVRKRLQFSDFVNEPATLSDNGTLAIRFRPVMTRSCAVKQVEKGHAPAVTDFPIANPSAFVPQWLRIDYRDKRWIGEFGYDNRG